MADWTQKNVYSSKVKMVISVAIAFNNQIFAEGVSKLLENDKAIAITGIIKAGSADMGNKLKELDPAVLLVDFPTLYNTLPDEDVSSRSGVILMDTDCGKENIVSAILKKRLSGVLLSNSSTDLLKEAIKAVAKGEVWMDKSTVKNLLFGINAVSQGKKDQLSEKEKNIVSLITQGFTNKEIATKIRISEPTVKTHLQRIFRKLNIKNRSQLVAYAVKNEGISLEPLQ